MSTRREFVTGAALTTVAFSVSAADAQAQATPPVEGEGKMPDQAEDPKITRARASGPASVTKDATVAEFDAVGKMVVLVKGTNEWVCTPGYENKIGEAPMCMNPMGMQWMMDAKARKPKPTNASPGIVYMLCGATQHSTANPADQTSPAIPIGPHWMVLWPFDAAMTGLPTTARDSGAWIMFAGTPYAYLHVCGDPCSGTEYKPDSKAVWTMRYENS